MDAIRAVLKHDELLEPSHPDYKKESLTWAAHKDLHPQLVARPKSLGTLAKLLETLNESDVEFNVRGGGCGNASSKGVLISMSAFDGFEFHGEEETGKDAEFVVVGAGQLWRHVDRKVEEQAPGYAVVGARCSYLGVGGSVLQGGISWLSSELGLASDPQNMLDAQIVLMDGTISWASSDPELLWALRGGGGRFGVVTAFKLRARKYSQSFYSGMITFPREALQELAEKVPKFAQEHGREAFRWALEIPGAVDMTKGMSYREVIELNDSLEDTRGQADQMMSAVVIPSITPSVVLNTFKWYEGMLGKDSRVTAGNFVIIEVMQKAVFQSTTSGAATGWPRSRGRHMLQLGTGVLNSVNTPELQTKAVERLAKGPEEILGNYSAADCLPRDFEEFHDVKQIFGENVEKLREVKRRVDPKNRLRGAYEL